MSATGGEPVGMAGIGAMMDRRRGHHEVSILIAAGTGVGRCFGSEPLAKVSMMNMRPPQRGHVACVFVDHYASPLHAVEQPVNGTTVEMLSVLFSEFNRFLRGFKPFSPAVRRRSTSVSDTRDQPSFAGVCEVSPETSFIAISRPSPPASGAAGSRRCHG